METRQEDFQASGWINIKVTEGVHFRDSFIKISILASTIGLLALIKCLTSCYSKRVYKQQPTIPSLKISKFAFYYMFLKNIYNHASESTPPLCLILHFFEGLCKLFDSERILVMPIGTRPIVFLFKPETAQTILNSSIMINKSREYKTFQVAVGTGLFTSSGTKWRQRRKLLNPAFHISILTDFVPIFYEKSNNLVAKIHTLTEVPWVDICPLTNACALDTLCKTQMGIDVDSEVEENAEFFESINECVDICLQRDLRPWLSMDIIFNLTPSGRRLKKVVSNFHGFTRRVIAERKAKILEQRHLDSKEGNISTSGTKKRNVLLDLLLEHHLNDPSFTEDDIAEEVDTFMVAGQDTTASSMYWSLYLLGLDERVQKKVHDELDYILQGDIDREITLEDLNRMRYLECVIKETLRIYPPGVFLGREITESFQVLNYTVQKGSTCLIFPYVLHHDPENFPEPERYLPERFFPENSVGRHPTAYIPFFTGPRNCIGQKYAMLQLKMVVANVLRSFQITSLDHRDKVKTQPLPAFKSVDPLRVRFKSRK